MNKKQEEAIAWFLDMLHKLQPDNKNIKIYKEHFAKLSEENLNILRDKLISGEVVLPYYSSNLHDRDVNIQNALIVGKELNIDFFQRIWLVDHITGVKYLTPDRYLVMHTPIRRQIQHVSKGKSVAENSKFIDSFTGQAAGTSQTSRLSLPEIMTLESVGLHKCLEELLHARGGDQEGFRYLKRSTINTGKYSLKDIEALGTRPTSINTLNAFFRGMHYFSNLIILLSVTGYSIISNF